MSRLHTLCLAILSRFGVDPAAGDLAHDVPAWPPASAPDRCFESPYDCTPTRWGEAPPAEERDARPREPRPAVLEETRVERPRRRLRLELDPQPTPHGLLAK